MYSGLAPSIRDGSGNMRPLGAPLSAVVTPSKKGVISDMWNWHVQESNQGGHIAHRNTLYADGHATRTPWRAWALARGLPLAGWFDRSLKY